MKQVGRLMAWHWHLIKDQFALLCGVYGIQQVVLLLLAASSQKMFGFQMADLFLRCGQMPLFFISLYLVVLTAAMAVRSRGRSHTMYTMYTMPFPRVVLPAAQMILCLVLLAVFSAWQVVLYAVSYFPVTALSTMAAGHVATGPIPTGSLPNEMNANPLFQLLLPVKVTGWLWLLGFLLLLSVQSACIACCRGLRRVVSMLAALVTAGVGAGALYFQYHITVYRPEDPGVILLAALLWGVALLPAFLNILSTAWALCRAESL